MSHSRVTRRHFLATTGALGGLTVAAGDTATLVGVQQQVKAAGSLALTGSWEQTITFQGSTPFLGLVTFNADGTLTETDQPDFAPQSLASPGHGVWVISGASTVRFKVIKLLFGSQGTPTGRRAWHAHAQCRCQHLHGFWDQRYFRSAWPSGDLHPFYRAWQADHR